MFKRKIAVVGLGKIAVDQHLPVIAARQDFELAAVVSQRGQGYDNAPVFTTPEALYSAMPEVDVIAFCTPPSVRYALVRDALRAGKHVLIEKPPTPTLSELLDLEELANEAGRVLFATWHCRFNPSVDRVRTILAADGVRSVNITWRESVWRWHPGQDWIWEPAGFGVFDPGINALSILTAVMPFPIHVTKATLEMPANRQSPIAAEVEFGSRHNVPITGQFEWRERQREVWDMVFETGAGQMLRISRGGGELRIDDQVIFSGPKTEYPAIYAEFARLLEAGKSSVDAAPLRLVGDALLIGRRTISAPFDW